MNSRDIAYHVRHKHKRKVNGWTCPKCGKTQINRLRCTGCGWNNGTGIPTGEKAGE